MRGIASERFAVRNSGAIAVVEGVGDHGCEYMTGGVILILGNVCFCSKYIYIKKIFDLGLTGRNFAAGMSGGIAYVWDIDGSFAMKCNPEMVELCKLEEKDDVKLVKELLYEFKDLTGSVIAEKLLNEFDERRKEFVKVFPYEYQRALKQAAMVAEPVVNSKPVMNGFEPKIQDIEDSVIDTAVEQKKSERALDKLRGKNT